MRRALLLAALALAGTASLARADAIAGPPACPPGSRGASSHAGRWCEPWPCASDAECDGGACRPFRVCTRASLVPPGGRGGFDQPPSRVELVVGTCDPARACTGTEEPPPPIAGTLTADPPSCAEARLCVPAALPPLPPRGTASAAAGRETEPASPATPGPVAPPAARGCACSVPIGDARSAIGLATLAIVLGAAARWRRR